MLRRRLALPKVAMVGRNMRGVRGTAEMVVGDGAVDNLMAPQPMGKPERATRAASATV